MLVITGGPGTGKTTLLTALLTILRRANVPSSWRRPLGVRPKRMTESAGEEAMTIHRLLEYNPREGGFQRSEDNPLQVDFVIVDEASMVDLVLMDHLVAGGGPAQPFNSGRRRRSAAFGGSGQRAAGSDRFRRYSHSGAATYFPTGPPKLDRCQRPSNSSGAYLGSGGTKRKTGFCFSWRENRRKKFS